MNMPIEEVLTIVRGQQAAAMAWTELLAICCDAEPDAPWATLPNPDVERDIKVAADWLAEALATVPGARGIYLGLDMLNMQGTAGECIEFGASGECDPDSESLDWIFDEELERRPGHLISGLRELHAVYETKPWKNFFGFCDYLFPLAYSGIVLAGAFERITSPRTFAVAWGFHDGDLLILGRNGTGSFTRVCSC